VRRPLLCAAGNRGNCAWEPARRASSISSLFHLVSAMRRGPASRSSVSALNSGGRPRGWSTRPRMSFGRDGSMVGRGGFMVGRGGFMVGRDGSVAGRGGFIVGRGAPWLVAAAPWLVAGLRGWSRRLHRWSRGSVVGRGGFIVGRGAPWLVAAAPWQGATLELAPAAERVAMRGRGIGWLWVAQPRPAWARLGYGCTEAGVLKTSC
jgi:hypothetical protein